MIMDPLNLAKQYLESLEKGALENVISLFHPQGTVDSPLYGTMNATDFYKVLGEDTTTSKLHFKEVFKSEQSNTIALYFTYHWILKNKREVVFDVVDIMVFDSNQKIVKLKIIYDTVVSRELVNSLKK